MIYSNYILQTIYIISGILISGLNFHAAAVDSYDRKFAETLNEAVESLPSSPYGESARNNPEVAGVRSLVFEHPNKVINLLTNSTSETDYQPTACVALSVSGDLIRDMLPKLQILLNTPQHTMEVASVLPHLGREGVAVLATGLTNKNVHVRQYSAVNLTYPLRYSGFEFKSLDGTYVKWYRNNLKSFYADWINALYDPEPLVGIAAAMGLMFAEKDQALLEGLRAAANDAELDKRVRKASERAIKSINGELFQDG